MAVPAAGWQFAGWSGDLTGSDNPAVLVIDGNKAVTATFTQNSGGSSGGGGGGSSDRIFLNEYMESPGTFNRDVSLKAYDGICTLTIPRGTVGKTKEGWALSYIILKPLQPDEAKPPAPVDGGLVSGIYRLEPDGVTFTPPIKITMLYREDRIPAGFSEDDLVIAFWDSFQNKWVVLEDSRVDIEKNLVTASLGHFSYYAVIGLKPEPAPAAFSISQVSISPDKVQTGETIRIYASVKNTGGSSGTYLVVLKINGIERNRQEVVCDPGMSATVDFSLQEANPGSYTFDINGYTGAFEVIAPPATTAPTSTPATSPSVIPVSPVISETPMQTVQPPVTSAEAEKPQSFNWKMIATLVGVIIIGIILTVVIITVTRRKQ
jgi:uncharacterized repeat protein (TIGR02543 family)